MSNQDKPFTRLLLKKVASGEIDIQALRDALKPKGWNLRICLTQQGDSFTVSSPKGITRTFSEAEWKEQKPNYEKHFKGCGLELIDELD
ncbi:hypothetical protein QNI16_14680 [Cytophagaceae bacterium YF14B1]|uniref:Uncharacterized protein n=1 Tax=Xanthocytophaga flava TaxID=3048013 RepID=A0AAE3U909_9BACT|nr:hypothetical protein [Xanthocytophaga flavus]MDJ1481743.1 hypothetical protein [Xanthocytophaga flavus]